METPEDFSELPPPPTSPPVFPTFAPPDFPPTVANPVVPPMAGPPTSYVLTGGGPPAVPPALGGGYFPPTEPPRAPSGHSTSNRAVVAISLIVGMVISGLFFSIISVVSNRQSPETSDSARSSVTVPYQPPASDPFGSIPSSNGNSNGSSNGQPFDGSGQSQSPGSSNGTDPSSGSSGSGESADSGAVSSKVTPGVVDINTTLAYQSAQAAGTGMILTASGEILTNNHVVAGATSITATVVTTGKTYKATVVGTDPTHDVAVVQLTGASGLSTISVGNPAKTKVGDPIVAIGNAGGAGGLPSVVTGQVTALGQTITASDGHGALSERLSNLIQVNAPIKSGDSGGPLANKAGEVIGINTAASVGAHFESAVNEGYAIPITDAMSIVKQIESGKATADVHLGTPGILGVEIAPATRSSGASGVLIEGTSVNSPAAAAGIEAGDLIVAIDGNAVNSPDALSKVMQSHHAGDKVAVSWVDASDARHTTSVTLAAGPAI